METDISHKIPTFIYSMKKAKYILSISLNFPKNYKYLLCSSLSHQKYKNDMYLKAIIIYIYNTCALSKHIGNMCMRLRNAGKCEASPSLFPRFAPNTHIYLYASTVHMYCIYPAILNRK